MSDTTSELRQIFDTVWHDAVNDNPAISEKEFSFENFEALLAAQKQRWEAAARIEEHNLVFTKTGELNDAELAFWSAERLEELGKPCQTH